MTIEWLESSLYQARNLVRRLGFESIRIASAPRAESLLSLHLHKLFSVLDIDVVLDVGARVGDYGAWLRRNGFSGRIISFEPVLDSYQALCSRSATDDRWDVVRVALGSEDGEAEINVTRQTLFSSFLKPNEYAFEEFREGPEVDHVERVSVRRLDGLLPEMLEGWKSNRIYLKMDTQGWDLEVLKGATGILPSILALQSEVSVQPIYTGMPLLQESLRALEAHGFSLSGLFPVTIDSHLRVVEFDCVCVAPRASVQQRSGDH